MTGHARLLTGGHAQFFPKKQHSVQPLPQQLDSLQTFLLFSSNLSLKFPLFFAILYLISGLTTHLRLLGRFLFFRPAAGRLISIWKEDLNMAEPYRKGEYVRYACNGVCLGDDIRLDVPAGKGTPKEFYILKPVSNPASTIFVPTGSPALVEKMGPVTQPGGIRPTDPVRQRSPPPVDRRPQGPPGQAFKPL